MFLFFFNDTATTEIYTLSLHDALPIFVNFSFTGAGVQETFQKLLSLAVVLQLIDRKSTRLNSSHSQISYAVFCLKKKNHSATQYPRSSTNHIYHSTVEP